MSVKIYSTKDILFFWSDKNCLYGLKTREHGIFISEITKVWNDNNFLLNKQFTSKEKVYYKMNTCIIRHFYGVHYYYLLLAEGCYDGPALIVKTSILN